MLVLEQGRYETVGLDLVFPVLHGRLGEDGAIQGLLELSGIPYVGCDVQSSALCMDKSLAYLVARTRGSPRPGSGPSTAHDKVAPDQFTYPVFVKPARSGSSFGVSKVTRAEDLPSAVETARQYDSKVLVEEAVVGSEVGCAILGERFGLVAGEVDRIALSHGFFQIHQEQEPEHGSENSTFIVPADISAEARLLVQQTAKTLYRALGCKGLARVDLFLKEDGTVVLNEVNTLPGLTSYSRYPRMMAAAGLPLAEVDRPAGGAHAARQEAMNDEFVFVDELVPGIRWDAKYATWDNFTGKPVDGYLANRIVGTRALCEALDRRARGGRIPRLRPAALGRLSPATRRRPLPALVDTSRRTAGRSSGTIPTSTGPPCSEQGYVAARSGHSRGSTVDLTLYHLATGELAPMGGDHDLMDPVSHHGAEGITPVGGREPAAPALGHGGRAASAAYACEWWHYTLKDEPFPDTYFDFPVTDRPRFVCDRRARKSHGSADESVVRAGAVTPG